MLAEQEHADLIQFRRVQVADEFAIYADQKPHPVRYCFNERDVLLVSRHRMVRDACFFRTLLQERIEYGNRCRLTIHIDQAHRVGWRHATSLCIAAYSSSARSQSRSVFTSTTRDCGIGIISESGPNTGLPAAKASFVPQSHAPASHSGSGPTEK